MKIFSIFLNKAPKIFYCIILLFILNAFAGEACKSKMQTYFFKNIYIITLCKQKEYGYNQIFNATFSIELEYQISASKNFLTDSSIENIESNYNLTEEEKRYYKKTLYNIFPSVEKADKIKLYYHHQKGIIFYYNNNVIGEITDLTFAKRMADIWIHPNAKFKNTRDFLFSETLK